MNKQVTKTKPAFIVDLTEISCCEDVKFAFIVAKATQGVKVDIDDIVYLVNTGADMAREVIKEVIEKNAAEERKNAICITDPRIYKKIEDIYNEAVNGRKPWYKRLWNWIKRPFCKK